MPVLVSFPLIYKLECWNFLPSHDGTINQIPPGIFKSTCKVKRHFLLNDILKCRRHFGFSDCPGGHHMVSVWWAELSPQIWHLDNTQRLSQSLARLVVTKLVLKGQCQEKIRYNFWANECFRTIELKDDRMEKCKNGRRYVHCAFAASIFKAQRLRQY